MGPGPIFLNKNCGKVLALNMNEINDKFGGTFGKTQNLTDAKFQTFSPTGNQFQTT